MQLDEPCLVTDLEPNARRAYEIAYARIAAACPGLKVLLATYFGDLGGNLDLAVGLPIAMLHVDLCRTPAQLERLIPRLRGAQRLSLGVVDGRNVWKNDLDQSLRTISRAVETLGPGRVALAPSFLCCMFPPTLRPS